MNAILFDTLKYANKLVGVGFAKEQVEVQAEALAKRINLNLATKRDVEDLKLEKKASESRVIIKSGAMLAVAVAMMATLVKLL